MAPVFKSAPVSPIAVVSLAWERANEILKSRDGAGFIFKVYTASRVFEGPPPSDHCGPSIDGTFELDTGDGVFIRQQAIEAIEVIEV